MDEKMDKEPSRMAWEDLKTIYCLMNRCRFCDRDNPEGGVCPGLQRLLPSFYVDGKPLHVGYEGKKIYDFYLELAQNRDGGLVNDHILGKVIERLTARNTYLRDIETLLSNLRDLYLDLNVNLNLLYKEDIIIGVGEF
jgi:hypothetical protein